MRVLDLSAGISGSYASRLMAGWGAEVIKVEKPGSGDSARQIAPFKNNIPNLETSALFLYLNTNKKSITLNLESYTGINILKELLKSTDILIENFHPGRMSELGLDYPLLEVIYPRLIMDSISWFGQKGFYSEYKASAMVAYAMGGQMYVCGQPDREPLNAGAAIGEHIGGLYGFIGAMMALQYREKTGQGQHVDISIFECLAGSHQFTLTWPEYSGVTLERPGWPGSRAPLSFYKCADGYINLRLQGIEMGFLSQLFGLPELADDPRFNSYAMRVKNIKELEALVTEKVALLNKQEVFRMAGEWRQLCGYVATPGDLLTDPQYRSRDFWVKTDHPIAGNMQYPGSPVKMTDTTWESGRAPLLGEHNTEVYGNLLGYSKEDIMRLRELNVI